MKCEFPGEMGRYRKKSHSDSQFSNHDRSLETKYHSPYRFFLLTISNIRPPISIKDGSEMMQKGPLTPKTAGTGDGAVVGGQLVQYQNGGERGAGSS